MRYNVTRTKRVLHSIAEGITMCYVLFVATNERRAEGNEGAVVFPQDNNNASNKVNSNNLRKFIHFAQNFWSFAFFLL